jgi:hypothetical protein
MGLVLYSASGWATDLLPRDRFSVEAGMFVVDYSSEVRNSSDELKGTTIALEDVLGLDEDDEILRVGASFRLRDRHELFVSYMNMSRDARKHIDTEIIYKDRVFPVNTVVETDLDLDIYRGGYTYYPWSSDRFELGLTIGAYYAEVALDMEDEKQIVTVEDSGSAPFPMLGLKSAYALSEKWSINGSAEYFRIDLDSVEGDFVDILVGLEYRFAKHFSGGLAYDLVRIEVEDVDDDDKLEYDYDGALLYLRWHI